MPGIRCYRSPRVEVRCSALEGKGIFALEKILPGEVVAIKLSRITATVEDYALQIHNHFCLSRADTLSLARTGNNRNFSDDMEAIFLPVFWGRSEWLLNRNPARQAES